MKTISTNHTYTRKEALEKGILHDASVIGRYVGFSIPVAISPGLRELIGFIALGLGDSEVFFIWNIFHKAHLLYRCWDSKDSQEFVFSVLNDEDIDWESPSGELRLLLGLDEDGLPCATIMMAWEA